MREDGVILQTPRASIDRLLVLEHLTALLRFDMESHASVDRGVERRSVFRQAAFCARFLREVTRVFVLALAFSSGRVKYRAQVRISAGAEQERHTRVCQFQL
jgi:hypothetical protein